jgi:hypothetical protein
MDQKLNTENDIAILWRIRSGRGYGRTKNLSGAAYERRITEAKKV